MKRIVIFLALLFVSSLCFAEVSTQGLTDVQRTELQAQAAKLAEANRNGRTNPPVPVVDQVDKWVDIGTKVGKGMAGAAKELGVVANDFIQTPVGKLTAALIFWKVAGPELARLILHTVGGPVFFVTMMTFWIWFFHKLCLTVTITERTLPSEKEGGKPSKIKTTQKRVNTENDGYLFICIVALVAIVALSIMITFVY